MKNYFHAIWTPNLRTNPRTLRSMIRFGGPIFGGNVPQNGTGNNCKFPMNIFQKVEKLFWYYSNSKPLRLEVSEKQKIIWRKRLEVVQKIRDVAWGRNFEGTWNFKKSEIRYCVKLCWTKIIFIIMKYEISSSIKIHNLKNVIPGYLKNQILIPKEGFILYRRFYPDWKLLQSDQNKFWSFLQPQRIDLGISQIKNVILHRYSDWFRHKIFHPMTRIWISVVMIRNLLHIINGWHPVALTSKKTHWKLILWAPKQNTILKNLSLINDLSFLPIWCLTIETDSSSGNPQFTVRWNMSNTGGVFLTGLISES